MSKWQEYETPKGILKWRYPNLSEGYMFLSAIRRIDNSQGVFTMKGEFASKMDSMVDYSGLGYSSYDEFLHDRENNMVAMGDIADLVFIEITKCLRKKN